MKYIYISRRALLISFTLSMSRTVCVWVFYWMILDCLQNSNVFLHWEVLGGKEPLDVHVDVLKVEIMKNSCSLNSVHPYGISLNYILNFDNTSTLPYVLAFPLLI